MAFSPNAPLIQVIDTNGNPIVGAKLHVYEVNDAALTTPMTNPLAGANASNAAGYWPVFYMAAGLYKLHAETSVGTLIWEVSTRA